MRTLSIVLNAHKLDRNVNVTKKELEKAINQTTLCKKCETKIEKKMLEHIVP